MDIRAKFSDEDLNRIKVAVRNAESIISGEIVPVIVNRSANYPIASYKAAVIFSSLAFATVVVVDRYVHFEETIFYDPLTMFLIVVAIGLLGVALANLIQPFKRLLITAADMDNATRQRAETAFLEEEVFNTRHRTGIMIFISFFEREVIVMADRGISKVVEQREWDDLVSQLTSKIGEGNSVEGLEEAISRCGEILQSRGFSKISDDINELRDDLRIDDQ